MKAIIKSNNHGLNVIVLLAFTLSISYFVIG